MKKMLDTFVSVVMVTDAYSEHVSERVKAAADALRKSYANYELIVVDNGLSSEHLDTIKKLLPKVACIRLVRLAKSDDIDTAIFAGLEVSIGDHIVTLYNNDPVDRIVDLVTHNRQADIVFGVARNLVRATWFERVGSRVFYWYNRKYLNMNIPKHATYFMCMNRNVLNALTRNNRSIRHVRQLAYLVGFNSTQYEYELPEGTTYSHAKTRDLVLKALDMLSGYSNHPLRSLAYLGVVAAVLNLIYALYVVVVNVSANYVERGWTTLSLQSSIMFFLMFMILAVLAEYVGKILVETRRDPPYHIMQELSSTISLADETRRNVTK